MSKIAVGTSSWTDQSLIKSGKFYPKEVKTPEERLKFYASRFQLTEVDSSYYGLPSEQNSQLWAERTPDQFRMNIKAFRLFTLHQTPPEALPKDIREALALPPKKNIYYNDVPAEIRDELWARFRLSLAPLEEVGKLVAVHFQFAPWAAFHPENFAHIEECVRKMEGFQLAVEFRNATWFTEKHTQRTLAFQRERSLAHVIVDEPQGVGNHIPSVWEVTTPHLAVVRLHGRNHATWDKKGLKVASQRFNYDYSTQELKELAPKIVEVSEQVEVAQVLFNNNYEDQGQRNAAELVKLLDGKG